MRWTAAAIVFATTGCSALFGLDSPPQAAGDATPMADGSADGPPGCTSFSKLIDTCTVTYGAAITVPLDFTFDTDNPTLPVGPPLVSTQVDNMLVVFAESFTVNSGT